jgi:hypothetical protein
MLCSSTLTASLRGRTHDGTHLLHTFHLTAYNELLSTVVLSAHKRASLNEVLRNCYGKNHTDDAFEVADEFSVLAPLRRESFRGDKEESGPRVEACDCLNKVKHGITPVYYITTTITVRIYYPAALKKPSYINCIFKLIYMIW